jgi:hypothetical protein
MTTLQEVCLGAGVYNAVYASFDGMAIRLSMQGEPGDNNVVLLGPDEIVALMRFVENKAASSSLEEFMREVEADAKARALRHALESDQ